MSKYRVFSGRYFPAFGLNKERYSVSLCIQSECGKIRTGKKLRIWTLFTQWLQNPKNITTGNLNINSLRNKTEVVGELIKKNAYMCLLLFLFYFFFYQGFLSKTLTIHRTAGEGRGPTFIPLYRFHSLTNIETFICNFACEMLSATKLDETFPNQKFDISNYKALRREKWQGYIILHQ